MQNKKKSKESRKFYLYSIQYSSNIAGTMLPFVANIGPGNTPGITTTTATIAIITGVLEKNYNTTVTIAININNQKKYFEKTTMAPADKIIIIL